MGTPKNWTPMAKRGALLSALVAAGAVGVGLTDRVDPVFPGVMFESKDIIASARYILLGRRPSSHRRWKTRLPHSKPPYRPLLAWQLRVPAMVRPHDLRRLFYRLGDR